ncbi:MAG: hypothetical protein ABIR48_04480 [Gammaproteobacteria bacterium]
MPLIERHRFLGGILFRFGVSRMKLITNKEFTGSEQNPYSSSDYSASIIIAPSSVTDYTGIENIHSKQFSVGIFVFLILGIMLFSGIVIAFMKGKNSKALKTGEKWLFAWIFFGILVSIIFGALQLLGGYLI